MTMRSRKKAKITRTKKSSGRKDKVCNPIEKSAFGYGVFAGKNYKADEIIDICPFIEIHNDHFKEINGKKNPLIDYIFSSHLNENHSIVVFGNGSMFNHSKYPNTYYYHDQSRNRLLYYKAMKHIKKGEELFISYGEHHGVNYEQQPTGLAY